MASGTRGPWLLVRAAKAGDAQLVARLLGEGRDENGADETGCTALILASENGHVGVVRLLLARQSIEVNKTAQNGATALMIASHFGQLEVLRLLLAHPAVEANRTCPDGWSALCAASENARRHREPFGRSPRSRAGAAAGC